MPTVKVFIEGMIKISLPVIVSIVLIAWPIILEVKATFREERKENARQFLYNTQLESVKQIVENVEKAFWLSEESNTIFQISDQDSQFRYKENRVGAFINLMNQITLNLRSIEIHMHFLPELEEQLKLVNEKLNIYSKASIDPLIIYDPLNDNDYRKYKKLEIPEKWKSLQDELESFRNEIIDNYGKKTQDLMKMSETDGEKWSRFWKK